MNTFLYSPNLFIGAIVGLDLFNPLAGIIVFQSAKKNKRVQRQFDHWLLNRHRQLLVAGDIPDAGTKEEKIAAMRDLFDRSKGRIKQLIIEKKGGEKVRLSQKGAWANEWRRWNVKGSSE
jgi:hypothetical protein